MKMKLAAFVLVASLVAFGQSRGRGMGQGSGMGQGPAMGQGTGMSHGQGQGPGMGQGQGQGQMGQQHGSMAQTQQPLRAAQINGGAFRMLENKTGMTADQLKQMYASSGAKNFGQFAAALMVSKNLNLDTQKVLDGMKTQSLGKTIQSLGVNAKTANAEIKKANKQIKDADSTKTS